MDNIQEKKSFNKRAFISTAMFLSGLLLPISGVMNHSLQLETFARTRHFWMSVHNLAAFLFTIFLIVHISFNWKALLKYIRKARNLRLSKESITAIVAVLAIVSLFSTHAFHVG